MTERKVVSRGHIFIFAPDEKGYEHIYAFLRSADFSKAYQEEDIGTFNIGLEAVLWILGHSLKGDLKPDLIFLETSLFPDRTRIDDRIVDFLSLQINDSGLGSEEKDALLLDVYRQYKLVYTALHDTQNTVYYVPEFLREASEMRMVFSEYNAGATYSDLEEVKKKESIKMNKITERINVLVNDRTIQNEIKKRGDKDSKGWVDKGSDVYVTRDFLLSRQSAENKREESTEDLELNAFIFHKLFHTKAFSQYKSSFLWCIPIVGAGERKPYGDQRKEHLAGQGALFVLLAYKREKIPLLEPEQQATDIARTVSYLLKDYFISYLYTSTREMVDQVIDRSLRMAVTAIMSRNMSHNIGSHVTPRTTVSAVEKRLDSFLLGQ